VRITRKRVPTIFSKQLGSPTVMMALSTR